MLWQRRYNKPSFARRAPGGGAAEEAFPSQPAEESGAEASQAPPPRTAAAAARKRPHHHGGHGTGGPPPLSRGAPRSCCPSAPFARGMTAAGAAALVIVVASTSAVFFVARGRGPAAPPPVRSSPQGPPPLLPSSPSSRAARVPVSDTYITLWLHQVHRWFKGERKVADFLAEARGAGFTSVMGNLPWAWTERDEGVVDLDSYDKGWMKEACGMGFRLHAVLTMQDLPPWLEGHPDGAEYVEVAQSDTLAKKASRTPNMAHPRVWELAQSFVSRASQMLAERYGDCLETVSPTWNNEFETRYVQTELMHRDYSAAGVASYREWLARRGLPAKDPPALESWVVCPPARLSGDGATWLRYRQEFLVGRYEALCRIIASRAAPCLLHFGEFFATVTDRIYSTPFFDLAQSPHVSHLVMDSNMALSGAPASPSIVGIMVSAAQRHNKTVHYEAATERIIDSEAEVAPGAALSDIDWERGSPLLLRRGVEYALDAGVQSIGVTNLRQPDFFRRLLNKVAEDSGPGGGEAGPDKEKKAAAAPPRLASALPFRPTALLYVPYQAFAGWFVVVSGFCSIPVTECWHESFRNMTFFGFAEYARDALGAKGGCPVDVAQHEVNRAWEDLRRRHEQVAVVGDVGQLSDGELLAAATERVVLVFPGVTDGPGPWKFYDGQKTKLQFEAIRQKYPFTERHLSILGKPPPSGMRQWLGWS